MIWSICLTDQFDKEQNTAINVIIAVSLYVVIKTILLLSTFSKIFDLIEII